jgi:hypothetical protein
MIPWLSIVVIIVIVIVFIGTCMLHLRHFGWQSSSVFRERERADDDDNNN